MHLKMTTEEGGKVTDECKVSEEMSNTAITPEEAANVDSNEESGEEVSSPEVSPGKLKNIPGLEELQEQLNGLTFDPDSFVKSLPAPVRRRVKALKKIQMDRLKAETDFYIEFHNLEAKYAAKFAPLDERRAHIVSGEVEPTDSECEWKSDEEEEESAAVVENDNPEAAGDTKVATAVNTPDVKGVPDFWLTILKRENDICQLIQEHDEPILTHLVDIKLLLSEEGKPVSFTLEFHFSPNDFFTNTVLTKKYNMKMEPDERDIMFEGPEISSSEGCEIEWKSGKNVTVKTIKKKQKHKKSGVQRTVTKQIQNESFFNFFTPPSAEEQDEPSSEEVEAQLQSDYEMGNFLREQLIPRAVLYFTGDAVEDESDDEEYDEDEDDEEDDDDDVHVPSKFRAGGGGGGPNRHHGGGRHHGGAGTGVAGPDDPKNADCKQQ